MYFTYNLSYSKLTMNFNSVHRSWGQRHLHIEQRKLQVLHSYNHSEETLLLIFSKLQREQCYFIPTQQEEEQEMIFV